MTRIKRGLTAHRRHRKIVKLAKGYRGLRSSIFTQAKNAVMKAGTNAYRDRKIRKRTFRRLWITRINAVCRENGITYSRFMNGLLRSDILLDRKVLANLAATNESAFKELIEKVKALS
ncbi:50S ribosomal protein L20 [Candidatus Peregrinibacteria bacterium]|nr:50S ribosomal protein L20 [Candidatus Peregrinibacteria bacterium]